MEELGRLSVAACKRFVLMDKMSSEYTKRMDLLGRGVLFNHISTTSTLNNLLGRAQYEFEAGELRAEFGGYPPHFVILKPRSSGKFYNTFNLGLRREWECCDPAQIGEEPLSRFFFGANSPFTRVGVHLNGLNETSGEPVYLIHLCKCRAFLSQLDQRSALIVAPTTSSTTKGAHHNPTAIPPLVHAPRLQWHSLPMGNRRRLRG